MVSKILLFGTLLLIPAWIMYRIKFTEPPKIPDLDLQEWWGPGTRQKQDESVRSFKIVWTQEMIKDLKHRLSTRRPLTPPLEGINFEYGFNTVALQPILDFWEKKYDFRARETYLNQFPQYKTKIQGLDIHFLRVKPDVKGSKLKVVPLLLLHGWPGSVREFYEVIPMLTQKRFGYDFIFEVIVPSLVGFGYSDAAVRPGMGPTEMAVVMRNLMHRLGHKKFYVQGGDWGSIIASSMVTVFPDEILGYHTNMPISTSATYLTKMILGSIIPWYVEPVFAARLYPLSEKIATHIEETGYFHIQATKPDTVGVAVSDSPAGLAAYILEKFSSGTNLANRKLPDGGLSQYRTEDLIDNLMFYWDSNCVTSSFRLYAEYSSKRHLSYKINDIPTPVPTWALHTANEVLMHPATLLRHKYTNLIDVSVIDVGGHFAAFEVPKPFTEDVFRAVRAFLRIHENK